MLNDYNIWKKSNDGSKITNIMTEILVPIIENYFTKLINNKNISNSTKEIFIKSFNKNIKKLETNSHKKNVLSELRGMCNEEKVFESMDNINPNLFAFNNGVYDLQNKTFRLPKPSELISCTCGYDFEKRNKSINDAIEDIHKIISSMMESDDDKNTLLSSISLQLSGQIFKEGFDIFIGQGGNGKGVLRDLISYTFGSYFDPMEMDYLTKTKQGQSATAADEVLARCSVFEKFKPACGFLTFRNTRTTCVSCITKI